MWEGLELQGVGAGWTRGRKGGPRWGEHRGQGMKWVVLEGHDRKRVRELKKRRMVRRRRYGWRAKEVQRRERPKGDGRVMTREMAAREGGRKVQAVRVRRARRG